MVALAVQLGFDSVYNFGEHFWFVVGEFAERFPIQFDLSLLEAKDESGVGQAVHTASRRNPGDPESAEVALLDTTVSIRELPGPDNCFFDASQQLAATAAIALGFFEQTLLGAMTRLPRCNSHVKSNGSIDVEDE